MNWDKPFWSSVLRADDGSPSFARLGSMLVLLFSLIWSTLVIVHTKVIPDLSEVRDFSVVLISSLYGVAKVSNLLPAILNKPNQS